MLETDWALPEKHRVYKLGRERYYLARKEVFAVEVTRAATCHMFILGKVVFEDYSYKIERFPIF